MAMVLDGIFFNPPLAIARLGSSDTPVEAFVWGEDPSRYGAGHTVIKPVVTLEVQANHIVRPFLPSLIHFKDPQGIRPTAPFIELWGVFRGDDGTPTERPLTLAELETAGVSLSDISYEVSVANRKAARRTGDPTCAFGATIAANATEFGKHELLASSSAGPGKPGLVFPQAPIPLGFLHVLRPVAAQELGVDLGVLRVRFIPARGYVYGPPRAIASNGPLTDRIHEIVPPERRILNPLATWCSGYDARYSKFDNPEPSDTYDGADMPNDDNLAWGVVDDTCDAILKATIVINGLRHMAAMRVFVGPPDFAPDRRPFASLADDFTERTHPEPAPVTDQTPREIADLFLRVFETLSLLSVDYVRNRAILENADQTLPPSKPPNTDGRTMTKADSGYAEKTPLLLIDAGLENPLPYSEVARSIHEPLANADLLQSFMRENAGRIRKLLRPPFASVEELRTRGGGKALSKRRDPRNDRDRAHDMRMPPYMRDELAAALSLNRRQYQQIMTYLDHLERSAKTPAARTEADLGPAERHMRTVVERRRLPKKVG